MNFLTVYKTFFIFLLIICSTGVAWVIWYWIRKFIIKARVRKVEKMIQWSRSEGAAPSPPGIEFLLKTIQYIPASSPGLEEACLFFADLGISNKEVGRILLKYVIYKGDEISERNKKIYKYLAKFYVSEGGYPHE